MKIEGKIEITPTQQTSRLQHLVEAIRRTRITLDSVVEIDITEPARASKASTIILGMSELVKSERKQGAEAGIEGPEAMNGSQYRSDIIKVIS